MKYYVIVKIRLQGKNVWNIEIKRKRREQKFLVALAVKRLISKRLLTLDLNTFVHVDGIDAIDFFSAGLLQLWVCKANEYLWSSPLYIHYTYIHCMHIRLFAHIIKSLRWNK